jgi:hypothetical protein
MMLMIKIKLSLKVMVKVKFQARSELKPLAPWHRPPHP